MKNNIVLVLLFLTLLIGCTKYNLIRGYKKNLRRQHFTENKYYVCEYDLFSDHIIFFDDGAVMDYTSKSPIFSIKDFELAKIQDYGKGYYFIDGNTLKVSSVDRKGLEIYHIMSDSTLILEIGSAFNGVTKLPYKLSSFNGEKVISPFSTH
jgi:hypothetical protein